MVYVSRGPISVYQSGGRSSVESSMLVGLLRTVARKVMLSAGVALLLVSVSPEPPMEIERREGTGLVAETRDTLVEVGNVKDVIFIPNIASSFEGRVADKLAHSTLPTSGVQICCAVVLEIPVAIECSEDGDADGTVFSTVSAFIEMISGRPVHE